MNPSVVCPAGRQKKLNVVAAEEGLHRDSQPYVPSVARIPKCHLNRAKAARFIAASVITK
jgi:hypothetical protein